MCADGQVAGVVRHALHDGERDVHARRPGGDDGRQRDKARRVRKFDDLREHHLVAQDGEERRARKWRLHQQLRRFAHAVERLVRLEGHLRGIAKRGAHLLVAVFIGTAEVEGASERGGRRRIGKRKEVFARVAEREGELRIATRRGAHFDILHDRRANAFRVPRVPAVRRFAIGVDRVDALDLHLQRLGFGEAAAIRRDAGEGDAGETGLRHLQPVGQRRADVERIVVAGQACAGGGGTATVLEHHALPRGANGRLGEARVVQDRRGECGASLVVERLLGKAAETRI